VRNAKKKGEKQRKKRGNKAKMLTQTGEASSPKLVKRTTGEGKEERAKRQEGLRAYFKDTVGC
jgi:hypothetical protein